MQHSKQQNNQNLLQDKSHQNEDIHPQQSITNQNQIQQSQQQFTPETIEHFNKICSDATQLMLSYKQQSEQLKHQISGMLNVYQKSTQNTKDAVPVEKIIQITKEYQIGMREANQQYATLQQELKKQQKERDQMMTQIYSMFEKLESMERKLKQKKAKQQQIQKQQQKVNSIDQSKELVQQTEQKLQNMSINQVESVKKA